MSNFAPAAVTLELRLSIKIVAPATVTLELRLSIKISAQALVTLELWLAIKIIALAMVTFDIQLSNGTIILDTFHLSLPSSFGKKKPNAIILYHFKCTKSSKISITLHHTVKNTK